MLAPCVSLCLLLLVWRVTEARCARLPVRKVIHVSSLLLTAISLLGVVQVDFLFDVYEEVIGDEPLSFLEVGCGPAQHSMEMAESKLNVFCVDSSPEMLEYAAALAAEDDIELTRVHADMRNFSLPVCPATHFPASLTRCFIL